MDTALHFHTTRIEVLGIHQVKQLCQRLIDFSQWFTVMPLPDDVWEIEIKKENLNLVQSWISPGHK